MPGGSQGPTPPRKPPIGLIAGGVLLTAALIAGLLFATGLVGGSSDTSNQADPLSIGLTAATDPGEDAFSETSFVTPLDPSAPDEVPTPADSVTATPTETGTPAATTTETPAATTPPATTQPAATQTKAPPKSKVYQFPKVSSAVGATPGLYGGTRNTSSCNAKQMIKYLQNHPDKARAWINAQNSDPKLRYAGGKLTMSNFDDFIAGLTPLVLRYDTYLTNHGFKNGRANSLPEFLEAGNAVLVDQYGVPRARCSCGNPLLPANGKNQTVVYKGTPWTGFNPSQANVVDPAPKPLKEFVIVDTKSGKAFARPVGTDGKKDKKVDPPAATPTFAPTATPAVTATTVPPTTDAPAPAATSDMVYNGPFGIAVPPGYDSRSNAYFDGFPDVPVVEVAQNSVDTWRDYKADPNEAGYSISDLTGSSTSPDLFFATVFPGLARPECPAGIQLQSTYGTANGSWEGIEQTIGPCTDNDQKTTLIVFTRDTDKSKVALLIRGPASTFDQTRGLALQSLSAYDR